MVGTPELTTFREKWDGGKTEETAERAKRWDKNEARFVAVLFACASISVCMDDRIWLWLGVRLLTDTYCSKRLKRCEKGRRGRGWAGQMDGLRYSGAYPAVVFCCHVWNLNETFNSPAESDFSLSPAFPLHLSPFRPWSLYCLFLNRLAFSLTFLFVWAASVFFLSC